MSGVGMLPSAGAASVPVVTEGLRTRLSLMIGLAFAALCQRPAREHRPHAPAAPTRRSLWPRGCADLRAGSPDAAVIGPGREARAGSDRRGRRRERVRERDRAGRRALREGERDREQPEHRPAHLRGQPERRRESARRSSSCRTASATTRTWNSIEAASPSSDSRKVIDVQKLLGLPDSTPNPHLWYKPKTMPAVAQGARRRPLARSSPRTPPTSRPTPRASIAR